MRVLVAHCEIAYAGRLDTRLAPGDRVVLFKDDGSVARPAYVTVLHNGVVVQNHFELLGGTFFEQAPKYAKHPEKQPIQLQNHSNPVRFRNIWVREMKPIEGKKPAEPRPE